MFSVEDSGCRGTESWGRTKPPEVSVCLCEAPGACGPGRCSPRGRWEEHGVTLKGGTWRWPGALHGPPQAPSGEQPGGHGPICHRGVGQRGKGSLPVCRSWAPGQGAQRTCPHGAPRRAVELGPARGHGRATHMAQGGLSEKAALEHRPGIEQAPGCLGETCLGEKVPGRSRVWGVGGRWEFWGNPTGR